MFVRKLQSVGELRAMDKQELFYGLQYLKDNGMYVLCMYVCLCVSVCVYVCVCDCVLAHDCARVCV